MLLHSDMPVVFVSAPPPHSELYIKEYIKFSRETPNVKNVLLNDSWCVATTIEIIISIVVENKSQSISIVVVISIVVAM